MQRKIAKVTWMDIAGHSSWRKEEEARGSEPIPITSVGFLIHKTRCKVVLALNYDHGGQVADTLTIPRHNITGIEIIGKSKV